MIDDEGQEIPKFLKHLKYTATGITGDAYTTTINSTSTAEGTWSQNPITWNPSKITWNPSSTPNFDPNKSPKWPSPTEQEEAPPTLPHPKRFLDGNRTRCPDCGAVTKDPTVLNQLPCKPKVVEDEEPAPPGRKLAEMFADSHIDTFSVDEPTPLWLGHTWLDPSTRTCWVWRRVELHPPNLVLGGSGEVYDGWFDVQTGEAKPDRYMREPEPITQYHPDAQMLFKRIVLSDEALTASSSGPVVMAKALRDLDKQIQHHALEERLTTINPVEVSVDREELTSTISLNAKVLVRKILVS